MEKELKISELAQVWGVSIPTVWKTIEKIGLKPFKKKDENNRNVYHVVISDEHINENFKEGVINHYKGCYKVNKVYKEDLQGDYKGGINPQDDFIEGEFTCDENVFRVSAIDKITELNKEFINILNIKNDEVINLYKEVYNLKSEQKLLEDKASREGVYLKEINDLKKENRGYKGIIKGFIISLIILFVSVVGCGFYIFIMSQSLYEYKKEQKNKIELSESVINDEKKTYSIMDF